MRQLAVHNPFNAPVYYEDTVDSTMNISRILARRGEPHGTVITADFQEAGRGRTCERLWDMEKGTSLACTILLRFPGIEKIPRALTLRTGLAVSLAIEDFAPVLAGAVMIKWPNDILITPLDRKAHAAKAETARKAAGILTEADGGNVHIGIGINVAQKQFPGFLRDRAISISLAANMEASAVKTSSVSKAAGGERFALLEKILACLRAEIETDGSGNAGTDWRGRIEDRLYKKGEQVCFIDGPADSGKTVTGRLAGIGPDGELLIAVSGEIRAFTAGELSFSR